ncbi:MAG: hypothetical protein H7A35_05085 [Planctomycetales bacterium]|nr:hypothetical protein [bacterium]UNM09432.1 MAG: hypothetical protein H7A35_05085 [Planctomycetales bacterium]
MLVIPVYAQAAPEVHPATELRPLDDPANPYLGQYQEWDIWTYEHFRPGMDGKAIMAELSGPAPELPKVQLAGFMQLGTDEEGQLHLWTYQKVDAEGFLVPAGPAGPKLPGLTTYAFASGPIEQAVYDDWTMQVNAGVASRYPPIPAFIGEHVPLCLVFVPNGEFAVKGPLGLGNTEKYDMQENSSMAARERWYRYSVDGELLGMTGVVGRGFYDNSWILLYWPELQSKIMEMDQEGLSASFRHGTVSFSPSNARHYSNEADALWDREKVFTRNAEAEVVECYDYYGQPISVEEAWSDFDDMPRVGQQIDAPIIKLYYDAQLSVGYTRSEASPFSGLSNGPVLAGDGYEPPVAAYPRKGGSYEFIEKPVVRALDAPGNPYAGMYSEWDRLCFENNGQYVKKQTEILNSNWQARQKLADDAKAAGKSLEQFKEEHPELAQGFPDENFEELGIVTLFGHVDDNGYLIPMAKTRMWPGSRSVIDYATDWVISATLQFDEETLKRFEDWKASQEGTN